MPSATITVKYVNPPKPGKKRGSIKAMDDLLYGVFPDKIGLFEVGSTYDITFDEQDTDGTKWRTIKNVTPRSSVTAQASPKAAPYRETSVRDAERMFCCSILNAGIKAGTIEMNGQSLVAATNMLRKVWQHTFGTDDLRDIAKAS